MKINENYKNLEESYLFSTIAKKVDEYTKAHPEAKVIKMGIGDVTLPICQKAADAFAKAAMEQGKAATFHGYGPEQGYDFLRVAVQKYYASFQVEVAAEDIFISDGAKSDVGNILDLFDADNTVLSPDPVYPVYMDTNVMAGRKIVFMDANVENGFLPMPPKGQKADIIYLCSPNNPTGAIMTRDELQAIATVIKDTNIVVLSDEIYNSLTYGPDRHVCFAELDGMKERTIVVDGFSKSYAMTGWRLGWAMGPKELMRHICKIHQFGIMSAPTTAQFAGIEAIRTGEDDIERMREQYDLRRRYLLGELRSMGLECFEPQGAFYMFPSIESTGLSSDEFCERLLHEQEVAVIPGSAFGESGEGHVRISYSYSMNHLREACSRIRKFLQTL